MRGGPLWKWLFRLVAFVAVAYLLVGLIGGPWPGHWDEASALDEILWYVFLVGGGALLLAGLWLFQRSPWAGAALVSLGAMAEALAIFWMVLAPILTIALVVLGVLCARRTPVANVALRFANRFAKPPALPELVYDDSPSNGAFLIDRQDQQYDGSFGAYTREPDFGSPRIRPGDGRVGWLTFTVPARQSCERSSSRSIPVLGLSREWTLR
jgi:hypothetical protein